MEKYPYSIKCLEAIAVLNGGRENIAISLDVKKNTIDHWFTRKRIPTEQIIPLCELSFGKFSAEELLGKYDVESQWLFGDSENRLRLGKEL